MHAIRELSVNNSGVDHRRSEHLVEVCRRSVMVMLDATFLALDLVRGAGAGAVDSDQIMTPEHGPVLKNLSALHTGKNIWLSSRIVCLPFCH